MPHSFPNTGRSGELVGWTSRSAADVHVGLLLRGKGRFRVPEPAGRGRPARVWRPTPPCALAALENYAALGEAACALSQHLIHHRGGLELLWR